MTCKKTAMRRRIEKAFIVFVARWATVALGHDEHRKAPVIVAKGRLRLAKQIARLARSAGVPIVENTHLTYHLYAGHATGTVAQCNCWESIAKALNRLELERMTNRK